MRGSLSFKAQNGGRGGPDLLLFLKGCHQLVAFCLLLGCLCWYGKVVFVLVVLVVVVVVVVVVGSYCSPVIRFLVFGDGGVELRECEISGDG